MPVSLAALKHLAAVPSVTVLPNAPLSGQTRFGIGGPAALLCDTSDQAAFVETSRRVQELALPCVIIGGGTNLVVSDAGFDGVVLRYTGSGVSREGARLLVQSGAILQDVVDESIRLDLQGLETMTGIPGYIGGAIYGNAGAYGHSIQELVENVLVTTGYTVRTLSNEDCRFGYRESLFKDRKEWLILSIGLKFREGNRQELEKTAAEIRGVRDAKYPPTMRCAGSIFKNVFFADLPLNVQAEVPKNLVREGKVPSAWFLEQSGAKGLRKGDIQVAFYHANLIYNDGAGTAADLVAVIGELKQRVLHRFGFALQEEVQYVGFQHGAAPA